MSRTFTDEEIERRLPVWAAMSDLWLDTEMQDYHYHYIASKIHDAGLTLTEAEEILLYDVAPAVYLNLYSLAGEWGGFNEEWLKDRICELSARPEHREWVQSNKSRLVGIIANEWSALKDMLNAKYPQAPESHS